ncbi:MAG TPA: phosphotransferase family protein [Amycolatopsis sp.]|nr:phosphotransferase family protein [Amycolatopsis sp.]
MSVHPVSSSDEAIEAIVAFLAREVGIAVRFSGRAPGNSHDGYIFEQVEVPGRKVLARLKPSDGPFLHYDSANEELLIKQLAAAGLAVPRVLASGGEEVCGTPFLVLEWIEGDVLNPQQVSKLPPAERRQMADEMVRALTRLHGISAGELPALDRPDGQDARPVRYFAQFDQMLDQLAVVDSVTLDYVRVWLQQHVDELAGETTLVHGDFRLGNVVWESGRMSGILDWETARMGNPLFDVGWMCMGARSGSDSIMGMVTRDEFVRLYRVASGRHVDQRQLLLWQVAATWVRGCTELRLLDLALQAPDPERVDPRDLSWQFGRHRTDAELLRLLSLMESA